MTTILPVIFNYNNLEQANDWYKKLKHNGFNHIILSDNGSKPDQVSEYTNFFSKTNIFFGGITYKCLNHCLKNISFDYLWICNTSGLLLDDINYYQNFVDCIEEFGSENVGIISPSFKGSTKSNIKEFHETNPSHKKPYTIVDFIEGVSVIVKKELLNFAYQKKSAYFNKNLTRGWGQDYEMSINSLENNYINIILSSTPIHFERNFGYKEKKRSESLSHYYKIAEKELFNYVHNQYLNTQLFLRSLYLNKLQNIYSKFKNKNCHISHQFSRKHNQKNHINISLVIKKHLGEPQKISDNDRNYTIKVLHKKLNIKTIEDLKCIEQSLYYFMHKFQNHPIFIQEISKIFFTLCFNSSNLGKSTYNIYFSSIFYQFKKINLIKKIEFWIRCLFKINRIL